MYVIIREHWNYDGSFMYADVVDKFNERDIVINRLSFRGLDDYYIVWSEDHLESLAIGSKCEDHDTEMNRSRYEIMETKLGENMSDIYYYLNHYGLAEWFIDNDADYILDDVWFDGESCLYDTAPSETLLREWEQERREDYIMQNWDRF